MTSSSTTATDNSFHMGAIHLSVPANMAACQVFTCVSMVKTQPAVMMDRQQLQFKLTDPPLTRKQFICNSFHFFCFLFYIFCVLENGPTVCVNDDVNMETLFQRVPVSTTQTL